MYKYILFVRYRFKYGKARSNTTTMLRKSKLVQNNCLFDYLDQQASATSDSDLYSFGIGRLLNLCIYQNSIRIVGNNCGNFTSAIYCFHSYWNTNYKSRSCSKAKYCDANSH